MILPLLVFPALAYLSSFVGDEEKKSFMTLAPGSKLANHPDLVRLDVLGHHGRAEEGAALEVRGTPGTFPRRSLCRRTNGSGTAGR